MEAILAILIFVVLIWGVIFLAHGGLPAGCMMVLIAGSCLGSFFFEIPVKPMPITLDRVLWGLLMVQYVLYRRFGKADPKPMTGVDWVLLVFIGWLTLGCFTHAEVLSSLPRLVFFYLMPLGLYWVARQASLSQKTYRAILLTFVVFAAYLTVTAIGEARGWSWLIYPRYIGDASIVDFYGRARGPFLNPIGNGLAICLGIISAIVVWYEVPRRWRLLLAFLLLLYPIAIAVTMTRCVWLGMIVALGILFLTKIPKGKRIPVVAYCVLIGCLLVATQWGNLMHFKRDKGLSAAEAAKSAELRPVLAVVAWKMFKEHPIDGVGLTQYDRNAKYYLADRGIDMPLERARGYTQHNVFLSLLTETGIVGMTLFIVLLVFWAYHGLKLWRDQTKPDWVRNQGLFLLAFLGAYLPNAMFQDVSQIVMMNLFLFFQVGLTMNLVLRKNDPAAVEPV